MEEYISKVDLKKMLGIHEAELIELVEKGILPFYLQKPDGTFQQIPLKVQDQKPAHRMDAADRPYTTKKTFYRCPTKEEIAHMLTHAVYFRRADIEDAKYEGKFTLKEKQRGEISVSEAAKLNRGKKKQNPAIREAIMNFLSNNPKILDEPANKIIKKFTGKFTSRNPCAFDDLDGNACEVYCDGDKIHSSIGGKLKKSLKKDTVQRSYLPDVKKTILQQKSNNPS